MKPHAKCCECENDARFISHVYENFSVFVCRLDHEGVEPWSDDTYSPYVYEKDQTGDYDYVLVNGPDGKMYQQGDVLPSSSG